MFHSEQLDAQEDFLQLQELDFSFNMVENEQHMWFLTTTKSINLINITGNPFAQAPSKYQAYQALEMELQKNLSAVIINDTHLIDEAGIFKRR
jgi:predicted metal-dependent RNase